MKATIVSANRIARSEGLRLDPDHYIDPTGRVDREIEATKRTLLRATKRLKGLRDKRDRILEEK